MLRRRSPGLQLIGAVAAALVAIGAGASTASATTFCVNTPAPAPGCSGTPVTGATPGFALSTALNDVHSATSGTSNTVELGAGTFISPSASGFLYAPTGSPLPVAIVGAGAATIVTAPATSSSQTVLAVEVAGSSVSSLTVQLGPATVGSSNEETGLVLTGSSGSHLRVIDSGNGQATTAATSEEGIYCEGPNPAVDHSTVSLVETGQTYGSFGITDRPDTGTVATVSDSTVSIAAAVSAGISNFSQGTQEGGLTVVRSSLSAPELGIEATGAVHSPGITIQDTLVTTPPGAPASSYVDGIETTTGAALSSDTVIAPSGASASHGAISADSGAIAVSDTIIRGGGRELSTGASGTTLKVRYSDFDPAGVTPASGSTIDTGDASSGNINADPLFASASDFHLTAGSPAVDAGSPGALSNTDSLTDLDGNPRLVDGARSGTARRDMGAYELPTPAAPAAPAPVAVPISAPIVAKPVIKVCHLPNVLGLSLNSASHKIILAGCKLGKVKTAHHKKHQRLVVTKELPKGSTTQPIGEKIALTIGPKPKKKTHKH